MTAGVLYLIGCAAPPVLHIELLIEAAQVRGWDTCLVLTPTAARWLEPEVTTLAGRTGHPVRSQYRLPGEPDLLPRADAMLVAPATGNTINKIAAGISDTLALGLANEAIAGDVPVVIVPSLGRDQGHPAFPRSVAALRDAGVTLVLPDAAPDASPDASPACGGSAGGGSAGGGSAGGGSAGFGWRQGLAALPGGKGSR